MTPFEFAIEKVHEALDALEPLTKGERLEAAEPFLHEFCPYCGYIGLRSDCCDDMKQVLS